MPIYEYYCPENHKIYQFYAKTLAQGRTVPACPDGAGLKMEKLFSPFAVTGAAKREPEGAGAGPLTAETAGPEEARMESALAAPRLNTDGTLNLSLEKKHSAEDEAFFKALGYTTTRGPSALVSAPAACLRVSFIRSSPPECASPPRGAWGNR